MNGQSHRSLLTDRLRRLQASLRMVTRLLQLAYVVMADDGSDVHNIHRDTSKAAVRATS